MFWDALNSQISLSTLCVLKLEWPVLLQDINQRWTSTSSDHLDDLILIFSTSRFHATGAAIYLEILNAFFLEEDWYPDLLKWIPNLKRWCTNRILSILLTKFTLATKFTEYTRDELPKVEFISGDYLSAWPQLLNGWITWSSGYLYSVDSVVCFVNTYPLDSYLSWRWIALSSLPTTGAKWIVVYPVDSIIHIFNNLDLN